MHGGIVVVVVVKKASVEIHKTSMPLPKPMLHFSRHGNVLLMFSLFDAAVLLFLLVLVLCSCLSQAIIIIPLLLFDMSERVIVCVFNALHILTTAKERISYMHIR